MELEVLGAFDNFHWRLTGFLKVSVHQEVDFVTRETHFFITFCDLNGRNIKT